MARKKKVKDPKDRMVLLFVWEMDAPAYREMSPSGRALLIEFRRLYNGSNNGEIGMSVREAAGKLGCSNDTASKALRELVEKGWIVANVKGAFTTKTMMATTWRITNQPVGLGVDVPATKNYMNWRSPENQNPVRESSTHGTKKQYRCQKDGKKKQDQSTPKGTASYDQSIPQRYEEAAHSYIYQGEGGELPLFPSTRAEHGLTPDLVKSARKRLGMGGRSLATAAGIPYTCVAMFESGRQGISPERAAKMSHVLGLSCEGPCRTPVISAPDDRPAMAPASGTMLIADIAAAPTSKPVLLAPKIHSQKSDVMEWTPKSLVEARRRRGWSGSKLAAEAGSSYSPIAMFEAGKRPMSPALQTKIEAAFNARPVMEAAQ